MNTIVYILLAAGLVFFGGATLVAFCWAAKTGQFHNLADAPKSVFDNDEPVGRATDAFADQHIHLSARHGAVACQS